MSIFEQIQQRIVVCHLSPIIYGLKKNPRIQGNYGNDDTYFMNRLTKFLKFCLERALGYMEQRSVKERGIMNHNAWLTFENRKLPLLSSQSFIPKSLALCSPVRPPICRFWTCNIIARSYRITSWVVGCWYSIFSKTHLSFSWLHCIKVQNDKGENPHCRLPKKLIALDFIKICALK